jgi:hypothetical protein
MSPFFLYAGIFLLTVILLLMLYGISKMIRNDDATREYGNTLIFLRTLIHLILAVLFFVILTILS